MRKLELAYCAGVIDSDGCITIKRRKRWNEVLQTNEQRYNYSASIFVRQVEPEAVTLLLSLFGGKIRVHPPSTPGGRDLNHWEVTHRLANETAICLLPFLRIKRPQALIIREFSDFIKRDEVRRHDFWFKWGKDEPYYTPTQAADVKGASLAAIYQMLSNNTIPSRRHKRLVFIPKRFWDDYQTGVRGRKLPAGYVKWCEDICSRIRQLNGPTRGVTTAARFNFRVTPE